MLSYVTPNALSIREVAKLESIEKIYQALMTMNPIIFAEYLGEHWGGNLRHRSFNHTFAQTMAGYSFRKTCQAVYYLTCLKKKLTRKEVGFICDLTFGWVAIMTDELSHIYDEIINRYGNPNRRIQNQNIEK